VLFSALLSGLFGDTRVRVRGLDGVLADLAERRESLTLDRRGVNANGACVGVEVWFAEACICATAAGADCGCAGNGNCCCWGVAPNRRHGDPGEFCCEFSEVCELVRARNLDGDRERERRRLRTAEETSIW
jgi:hypothetical protein